MASRTPCLLRIRVIHPNHFRATRRISDNYGSRARPPSNRREVATNTTCPLHGDVSDSAGVSLAGSEPYEEGNERSADPSPASSMSGRDLEVGDSRNRMAGFHGLQTAAEAKAND